MGEMKLGIAVMVTGAYSCCRGNVLCCARWMMLINAEDREWQKLGKFRNQRDSRFLKASVGRLPMCLLKYRLRKSGSHRLTRNVTAECIDSG